MDQSVETLGKQVTRQSDELKLKNGQLRQSADQLRQSDVRVRLLTQAIDSAEAGVFLLDVLKPGFPIVFTNPAYRKMTGLAGKDLIGLGYLEVFSTPADSVLTGSIRRAIQRGEYFYADLPGAKKSGKEFWSQLRLAPIRLAPGAITHFLGIQTDITQIRRRDLEIKDQREELIHVTRVGKLAEFVSSLAHEISQPLTAILAYAQAAQRMLAKREPKFQELLQYIVDDDIRAVEVIRRMRTLLKKRAPDVKPLELNALINDTLTLVATDASVRHCELRTDLAPGLPRIFGDRIQLQQVLLNLLSNSFDALEKAPGAHEVRIVTARQSPDRVLVTVQDTGPGIPAENLPKLFSRFFTSKPDGLGMGLSISRSIVEAHGGRLTGENNSGQGASFKFTLPFERGDSR